MTVQRQFEASTSGNGVVGVGGALLESEGPVDRYGGLHSVERVEKYFRVADRACFAEQSFNQKLSDSVTASLGPDVQAFHFANSLADFPQRDAADEIAGVRDFARTRARGRVTSRAGDGRGSGGLRRRWAGELPPGEKQPSRRRGVGAGKLRHLAVEPLEAQAEAQRLGVLDEQPADHGDVLRPIRLDELNGAIRRRHEVRL